MDCGTMPDDETDVTFGDLDFDTIEAAVMETARGRWFLKEDTQAVLEAVDSLKAPALDGKALVDLKADLLAMAAAIHHVREEIRSFPVVDDGDPLNTLSDAELQTAAEQRIRHMVRTIQGLDSRVRHMIALCNAENEGKGDTSGTGPFEGEKAQHLHPHPAFLM
jgi:hypothetical protein